MTVTQIGDQMKGQAKPVWIVVPTLNESRNIQPLLQGIRGAMEGLHYYVCFVDDGSRDGTVESIRASIQSTRADNIVIIQREKRHLGSQRGGAVWTGLQYGLHHSTCQVFVEMDDDLSHRPEELRTGIEAV